MVLLSDRHVIFGFRICLLQTPAAVTVIEAANEGGIMKCRWFLFFMTYSLVCVPLLHDFTSVVFFQSDLEFKTNEFEIRTFVIVYTFACEGSFSTEYLICEEYLRNHTFILEGNDDN